MCDIREQKEYQNFNDIIFVKNGVNKNYMNQYVYIESGQSHGREEKSLL